MKIQIPASVTDRTRDALQRLENHMNKQANFVQDVQVLSNVSVDVDRSLHLRSLYDDARRSYRPIVTEAAVQIERSGCVMAISGSGRGRSGCLMLIILTLQQFMTLKSASSMIQ